MSMDETYVQMQKFERELRSFNEHLKASLHDLETHHEHVSPHWQDEMRKQYDLVWGPFLETMKYYVTREGPDYIEFLNIKLQALRRYLRGG